MGEVHYMISEAAKRVDVETHVLRYWEEELEIPIERTGMGHRYYTEENIRLFQCIKELKAQGLMLKELKEVLPEILKTKQAMEKRSSMKETAEKKQKEDRQELVRSTQAEVFTGVFDEHTEQIQKMFGKIVRDAMNENNEILEEALSRAVSDKVMKEMDYLLQTKERQEEERFQKLDHLIRQQQTMRKEAARPTAARKFRRIFGTA